ncbi:MAG TPA: glycosyltransferase family 4 protein [Candidatus Cybelea sp.]|nr:glycosyltransferase family 4 protein [Candidatus Cybelea sp.]
MSASVDPSEDFASESNPQSKRFRWIVAQEGSRQTYGVPLAFHRLGKLRILYADIWCRLGRGLLRRGPSGTRALATRFHAGIPKNLVVSFSPAAILAKSWLHFRRARIGPSELSAEYCRFGRWYAGRIRRHLEGVELDPESDCFFGFNTNCLELMDFLKERRVFTVIDQVDPARVEEDMILEEVERWPGWAAAPGRMTDQYWQRIEAEWKAADCVLANSDWSRKALIRQGVASEKIIVVPLALELGHREDLSPVDPVGPLKVLWLGNVALRKGIPYLVEAARSLQKQNIEFVLAGPLAISQQAVKSFPANITILGRVTRDHLHRVYRQAHVFVLPTISDGFAITQLEAMAHGLPVVTTPNCGQVVTHGLDGFIVPARDGQALADALARLDADRPLLREMSRHALQTVKQYDLPSNARLINKLVRGMRDGCQQTVLPGATT